MPPIKKSKSLADTIKPDMLNSVGWRWRSACLNFGILQITKEGKSNTYFCQKIVDDVWNLQKLEKKEGSTHYLLSMLPPKWCGCIGWEKGKKCKHMEAFEALKSEGKL